MIQNILPKKKQSLVQCKVENVKTKAIEFSTNKKHYIRGIDQNWHTKVIKYKQKNSKCSTLYQTNISYFLFSVITAFSVESF